MAQPVVATARSTARNSTSAFEDPTPRRGANG